MTPPQPPEHPQGPSDASPHRPRRKARNRCRHVLLVQDTPVLAQPLEACGDARHPVRVVAVPSAAEARDYLAGHTVDLAVVDHKLPDGSGIDFTHELSAGTKPTTSVVVADNADLDTVTAAMRAGACDFLVGPVGTEQLRPCLDRAMQRRRRDAAVNRRIRRLRRLCRQLNDARVDVSRQVDILCTDLVTAYQELAAQFQNVVQTSEFNGVIKDELDLESLLRKTLEYLVGKAGPANAAIFLPATMDEYSLGGYVNYDCTSESADMLLEHLADVVAPKLASVEDYVHFTNNRELRQWFDDDAAYLADSEVIGVPCVAGDDADRECLAVIVLFRDREQPFTEEALEACSSLGATMGTALEKVIRCHHRAALHDDEAWDSHAETEDYFGENDDDDALPF